MSDTNVELGTPEPEAQGADDLVEIAEASDLELEDFISSDKSLADDSERTTPPAAQHPAQKETGDKEKVEPGEPAQPPQRTEADFARIEKRLADQIRIASRRSNEIGELRKQNAELQNRLRAHAEEIGDTDPRTAAKIDRKIEELDAEGKRLENEEEVLERQTRTAQLLHSNGLLEHYDPSVIVDCLVRDGVSPEIAREFAQSPGTYTEPELAVQIVKRAQAEQAVFGLVDRLKAQNKEIATLKSQLAERGKNVVAGMKKALNSPPPVTADAGARSRPRANAADSSFADFSDAELEEFLASGSRNGKNSVRDE